VKFVQQKLFQYYTEDIPMTDILLISAHILHFFRKLQSVMKCDRGIQIISEDEASYTTQYQEAFLK